MCTFAILSEASWRKLLLLKMYQQYVIIVILQIRFGGKLDVFRTGTLKVMSYKR
jgi:hypothetical protein